MKEKRTISILIALCLLVFAIIVGLLLSSTFQDSKFIIYDLFGRVIGGMGILYIVLGFLRKMQTPIFSKWLYVIGTLLLLIGGGLAINYHRNPVLSNLPDELSYFKFVHIQEVYSKDDSTQTIGYKYIDTPFTKNELDTLIEILKEEHKEFIIGKNEDILVSKRTIFDAVEMNRINDLLRKRMQAIEYKP
jgi:hypothetical protein